MTRPVVDTSTGRLSGVAGPGVFSFRGIPYGADTSGARRFRPPQPIGWPGVLDAAMHGPRAPQVHASPNSAPHVAWQADKKPQSETCLVLNVFTASLAAHDRLPVMVYLHGGGFAFGSAGGPGLDGANLARRGVVLVSLNHRLNVFGHLYLGDDDEYADSGNAGLLDVVAALEWVHHNIAVFGGDPSCVTLLGQSGGGSKVATLLAMPRARGLFHRAIVQSSSSMLRMATREDAERNTHYLFRELGLRPADRALLHDLPVNDLLAAMRAGIQAAGGIDNYRPVVDGRILPDHPFDQGAPPLSADIPLIVGWCETEQRLRFALTTQDLLVDAAAARARVAAFLDIPETDAEDLMRIYGRTRFDDTPGDIMALIYGDQRYRRTATKAAELRSQQPGAATYMYLLRWQTPVLCGMLRTPHTLCIPFVFGNVDLATGITGTDPSRYAVQEAMAGAWVEFARSGSPNGAGRPVWQPYSTASRHTMVFDLESRSIADPAGAERVALERCPDYLPAEFEGGRRL